MASVDVEVQTAATTLPEKETTPEVTKVEETSKEELAAAPTLPGNETSPEETKVEETPKEEPPAAASVAESVKTSDAPPAAEGSKAPKDESLVEIDTEVAIEEAKVDDEATPASEEIKEEAKVETEEKGQADTEEKVAVKVEKEEE